MDWPISDIALFTLTKIKYVLLKEEESFDGNGAKEVANKTR